MSEPEINTPFTVYNQFVEDSQQNPVINTFWINEQQRLAMQRQQDLLWLENYTTNLEP